MKRLPMAWTRGILLAVAAALLSACDGVGDGNKPESATLVKLGNRVSGTTVYTCFSETLQMLVTFSDGGIGNFSNRAKWSSSDPSVLYVSTYGDKVPAELTAEGEVDQVFLAGGVLYPRKTGSATITATAAGQTQTMVIEVKNPTDMKARAVGYFTEDAASVVLGPNTVQTLQLTAKLDGFTFDQTANAGWEFVTPNTDVASFVTDTSIVQTTANTGGSLRARPVLRGCSSTGTVLSGVGLDLKVLPIQNLTLKRELDAPKNVNATTGRTTMVVDTSEILQVFARFDTDSDAGTAPVAGQNLSGQVLADSTDEGVLLPGIFGLPTAVLALSDGDAADGTDSDPVTVTFCVPKPLAANETTRVCSDDVNLKLTTGEFVVRTDTLESFTIASSTGSNNITALNTLQLRAEGTFASDLVQDVTRNVAWTSSATDTITIGATRGLAQSVSLKRNTDGSIAADQGGATITATNDAATVTKTRTLDLEVVLPSAP